MNVVIPVEIVTDREFLLGGHTLADTKGRVAGTMAVTANGRFVLVRTTKGTYKFDAEELVKSLDKKEG